MDNANNSIDDQVSLKIIDTLSILSSQQIDKLAEEANISQEHLRNIINGTEQISCIDKGKLIEHLIKLMDDISLDTTNT